MSGNAYTIPGFQFTERADVAATIPQYGGVVVGATGLVLPAVAGAPIDGVAQMPAALGSGEAIPVMVDGITFAVAGAGGVVRGGAVQATVAGEFIALAAGTRAGKALTPAAAGELFALLLG